MAVRKMPSPAERKEPRAGVPMHSHEWWLRRSEEHTACAREMVKLAQEMCAQAKEMRKPRHNFILP